MIPLLVLATAGGLFFFALVETAFGLLMRLPQRLEAERATPARSQRQRQLRFGAVISRSAVAPAKNKE